MIKTGFYPFITNEDILLIGLIGLILVLKNWWDIIQYGLRRAMSAAAAPGLATPGRSARLPRALRRLQPRRRAAPRPLRPGHRPVGHGA